MPGLAGLALREAFPLRLIIGGEDMTRLLDSSFTFSNIDPGGYESAMFSLPKDLPQIVRGTPVVLYCGTRTAWEGRVKETQRSLGSRTQIICEGYAAILKDQEAAEIFVDRDLTKWQPPTTRRQIEEVKAKFNPQGPQVAANPSGIPSIVEQFTGPWEATGLPLVEAWYNAQGIQIGSILYQWTRGEHVEQANANWGWEVRASSDDILTASDATGNLRAAGPGEGTLFASAGRTWALLQHFNIGASGGSNVPYAIYWTEMAVYGRHGLTTHAYTGGFGFYPFQIAAWVEQQTAALGPGVIPEITSYIIPHYVQLSPVSLDTILNDMAIQGACHWGVWEPLSITGSQLPRLDFRPRPALGEWTAFCQRRDCDTLDLREDLSGLYSSGVVEYTNVDGTQGSVTVNFQNPLLEAVGLTRTVIIQGGTMTPASAKVFGEQALALLYSQARVSGSATISGTIDGPAGPTPAWMLKAGIDRLRIGDMPSTDAFGQFNDLPITRVECAGSESGFSTTLEFGQGAYLLESLQARLAAATTLAAQGGV